MLRASAKRAISALQIQWRNYLSTSQKREYCFGVLPDGVEGSSDTFLRNSKSMEGILAQLHSQIEKESSRSPSSYMMKPSKSPNSSYSKSLSSALSFRFSPEVARKPCEEIGAGISCFRENASIACSIPVPPSSSFPK